MSADVPDVPAVAAPESAPAPDGLQHTTHDAAIETLVDAIASVGNRVVIAQDPREVEELSRATLALAQAVVILDPALVAPGGVPPEALHPPEPRPRPKIQESGGAGE